MYTVHGRGADFSFLLRFGHGPILIQINLQNSQAQPYGICTGFIYLQKCGASHREAIKVFGMTRPRVDYNPRPPEL